MSQAEIIAEEAVKALIKANLSVSFAESCTGGLLSQLVTSVSGASQIFELGICCYSNNIKNKILKVPNEILNTFGAISQETATVLAKEIMLLANSDIGVSVTGVAGPSKSENKEVGTVYIGFCSKDNAFVTKLNANKTLSRNEIRELAATTALNLIKDYCYSK